MEHLLLQNLRRNQTFAAAVRKGSRIDALANGVLQAVLSPAEGPRKEALAKVEREIVQHYATQIQPAARQQGAANAKAVLSKLGPAPDLSDPATRRQILLDGNLRPADRLKIVQSIVNDKANTLDNRLAAYWLEPGRNPREKLEHLKALHHEQEAKRLEWERAMLRYQESGETGARPRKPNLDYLSKFTSDAKQGTLEQARRAGTDAELETFVKAGYERFTWITVNASDACPSCRERQGRTGDAAYWDREGRPGGGQTFCGARCFCLLIPEKGAADPKLKHGLNVPRPAPVPVAIPSPLPSPQPSPVGTGESPKPAPEGPKPTVGYHGSPKKFDAFTVRPGDTENKYGPGVYFAPEKAGAVNFVTNSAAPGVPYHLYTAEAHVGKVYDAGKALPDEHFDQVNRAAAELGHQGLPEGFRGGNGHNLYKLLTTRNEYSNATANKILQHAGFDAVKDPGEFVVFDPAKVKVKAVKTYKAKAQSPLYSAQEAAAPAPTKGPPPPPPPGAHPAEVQALHERFTAETEQLHAKFAKAEAEVHAARAAFKALPEGSKGPEFDRLRADVMDAEATYSRHLDDCRRALDGLHQTPGNLTAAGNRNIIKEGNVQHAMDLARPLFGAGSPMERSPVKFQRSRNDRAYQTEDQVFIGGKKTKPPIILHEMGHNLEERSPACARAAREFLERRTAGETPRPLSQITGNEGFGRDEMAKEDHFFNPYCGKLYDDATEITSMGIQRLAENPVKFAREDPDYFQFTLAQLRRREEAELVAAKATAAPKAVPAYAAPITRTPANAPPPPPPGAHPPEVQALHAKFVEQTEHLHAAVEAAKAETRATRDVFASAVHPAQDPPPTKKEYNAQLRTWKAAQKACTEADKKLAAAQDEARKAVSLVYHEKPVEVTPTGNMRGAKHTKEALRVAGPLFGEGSAVGTSSGFGPGEVRFQTQGEKRAYYHSDTVFTDFTEDPEVVLHELGHHLEARSPAARAAAHEFLARRTEGGATRPLAEFAPGHDYGADEVAKEDQFYDPYVGKIYQDGATEVTSMGIERLMREPVAFAREDPDHFQFTLAQLRRRD